MEVYIDDILVKSAKKEDHIDHLKEAFEILRWYGMKLNLEKCTFGMASRRFLGFLVSQRGIEVNPDQIKAIDAIPETLNSKKHVQKLTGRIAALSRFISRSYDRCHKFFNVLRKDHGLQWNEECIEALRKLKAYLSSPPLLVKANPSEPLLVYLAVSEVVVSAVLVRENKGIKLAVKYGARRLVLHCDSQLVMNQITGTYQIKEQRLQKYQSKIHKLMLEFDECRLEQIPRAQNVEADGLAKLATATKNINKGSVVTLLYSAIDHAEISLRMSNSQSTHLNVDVESGYHSENNNVIPSNDVPPVDPNSVLAVDPIDANSQVDININLPTDTEDSICAGPRLVARQASECEGDMVSWRLILEML
ncbi:PREDICTED: uncharacterized protein LOC109220575 [Nicotiana attenuata]|uniref:uncharacterized protein LOC109220575 n=1 Tax=Nicotiana attenuata TaxID=49451 RepID=UPI000905CF73|nr:PREDICTED: uncharacterized protein LOC109220575 [Nicotiana attenuata]